MFKWLNTQVIMTLARYALAAVGGWLVAKGWLPAEGWDEIAGAILIIISTIAGAAATMTPKVVTTDGHIVKLASMPTPEKRVVEKAAKETAAG